MDHLRRKITLVLHRSAISGRPAHDPPNNNYTSRSFQTIRTSSSTNTDATTIPCIVFTTLFKFSYHPIHYTPQPRYDIPDRISPNSTFRPSSCSRTEKTRSRPSRKGSPPSSSRTTSLVPRPRTSKVHHSTSERTGAQEGREEENFRAYRE